MGQGAAGGASGGAAAGPAPPVPVLAPVERGLGVVGGCGRLGGGGRRGLEEAFALRRDRLGV